MINVSGFVPVELRKAGETVIDPFKGIQTWSFSRVHSCRFDKDGWIEVKTTLPKSKSVSPIFILFLSA